MLFKVYIIMFSNSVIEFFCIKIYTLKLSIQIKVAKSDIFILTHGKGL